MSRKSNRSNNITRIITITNCSTITPSNAANKTRIINITGIVAVADGSAIFSSYAASRIRIRGSNIAVYHSQILYHAAYANRIK